MLEGQSIICFAHDWGGDPTSKTHIMRILSRRNRVLWVNSIGMRRPRASGRDLRRLLAKLRRGLAGCTRVAQNFHVCNPLVLPLPGVPGVAAFNTGILSCSLRRLARRLQFLRPIVWTFLPNVNGLVGRLDESLAIYHCVDEYTAFSGVARQSLQQMERSLLRKADLVLTSSEQLWRDRQAFNPNVFFVSHGVDVAHFAAALDPQTPIPDDMQAKPRPVVGFFGLIADWIDLPLIRHMALARPGWSVVLVGKATTSLDPIRGLPNVHLLGQRPYDALPGYCKAFDVGIIPFRINELTLKANPLKLREYLAAGLPVVSTDLPEVRKYAGLVSLAADAEAFVRAVEVSCVQRNDASVRHRVDAMTSESWESRVEEISALVMQSLAHREQRP